MRDEKRFKGSAEGKRERGRKRFEKQSLPRSLISRAPRESSLTIASMQSAVQRDLRDVHSEEDGRRLELERAGVKGLRYPICVLDRANGQQHTVAEIDMSVSLPHRRRGAHMSRFVELLNRHRREIDIRRFRALCAELRRVHALLKRPDEKWVTERAYERPRFVEDLVREVGTRLRRDRNFPRWEVEAESLESIHAHSAYARLSYPGPARGGSAGES